MSGLGEMRITEQTSRRMTHKLGRGFGIAIRRIATGIELLFAEKAFATGNRERHHDAVAHLKVLHILPDLDNIAHRLMAKYVAFLHRWHVAIVKMKI